MLEKRETVLTDEFGMTEIVIASTGLEIPDATDADWAEFEQRLQEDHAGEVAKMLAEVERDLLILGCERAHGNQRRP